MSQARALEFLWGPRERPTRGPKPGLSIERIVSAAIAIADADGIDAVSMQRVASEVGFATMALYRYVPGKTELIGVMADTVLGEPPDYVDLPDEWRPRLERWARRMRAVFQEHAWALRISGPGRVLGPNELGWIESAVQVLASTGLTGAEQTDAVLAISGHVKNWVQYSAEQPSGQIGAGHYVSQLGELVVAHQDRYPALMTAISAGAVGTSSGEGEEFGLRCVLDGIGVRIAERVAAL